VSKIYYKQKDRQFNWPKEEQAIIYKTLDRKLEIEQTIGFIKIA
jgi:hypothetical protein